VLAALGRRRRVAASQPDAASARRHAAYLARGGH
jgi:hypothetical protein